MENWRPGTTVGRYQLVARIGSGGMGEVWKALDSDLGRPVAIKRLFSVGESFLQEARAIAALNHPHICTVHDVGSGYFVMELLDGRPLTGPLSPESAVTLALQIAAALEAAHASGIIHCDLKPANVVVADGRAKLLDFGISRQRQPDAEATFTAPALRGTPGYMSPEQAQGQVADARSDIFSFGALFYELLAGRPAFGGGSAAERIAAVLRDRPAPFSAPAPLVEVIERCLEKDPGLRYQTMRDVIDALRDETPAATEPAAPSIAVLPFANMSSDPEQEYFSDGLTEEIINALGQLPGLKVIARTSSFAFKGRHLDIREIARALGVTTILEGSVRKGGSRIRVTAQLIDVADGSHVWSERYDRDLADVFAVQDEIAAAIRHELSGKLATEITSRRLRAPRVEAYDAYLMARHLQWTPSPTAYEDARASYERAAALDSGYAAPHTGLAEIAHIAACGRGPTAQAQRARVREEAERAMALDPHLAEAHAWLGILATSYDYDWAEAKRRFEFATARDPRLRHWNGYFHLRFIGQTADAIAAHEAALREDPLSLIARAGHVLSLLSAGRRAEATRESRRLIEAAPTFTPAYSLLAFNLPDAPLAEALRFAERGHALWSVGVTGLLAGLLQRSGDRARAETLMQSAGEPSVYGSPVDHALFWLAQDDTEAAIPWIEQALDQHHPFAMMVLVGGPYGARIRASSGWPAIARTINLPA